MSDFDVKEKRFEEDIEDYLTHHGGYTKGDPKKFNRESGLEEDTFVEFIKTSQPKKWERYVKIYAENSEKQIIERFKREVKTTNLLNVMRHGFMDRGIKFYPIFWKPETSLNETTQMQYDANILHCTRQLHYSVHNEEMHKGSAGNVQMNQSIESILRLALNWEQVNGIVINPFGKYIQMTKKMIELLINGYEYNENERKSKDDENN